MALAPSTENEARRAELGAPGTSPDLLYYSIGKWIQAVGLFMSDSTEAIRQSIERTRRQVQEQRIATLRTRVAEALECQPTVRATVYLFGSWASGRFDALSDVDLLVLVPNETMVLEAEKRLMGVADDIVAFSDAQWSRCLKGDNSFFRRVDADRVLLVDTRESAQ